MLAATRHMTKGNRQYCRCFGTAHRILGTISLAPHFLHVCLFLPDRLDKGEGDPRVSELLSHPRQYGVASFAHKRRSLVRW